MNCQEDEKEAAKEAERSSQEGGMQIKIKRHARYQVKDKGEITLSNSTDE